MAIKWENTLDILSLRQRVFKPQVILRLLWFFFLSKSVCKVAFYDLINYTFIPVKLCTWRLSYIKIIPISEVNLLAHLNWFSFFFSLHIFPWPLFIHFLFIYFPSKLGRGKPHKIVVRNCTISLPSQLLKLSLQGMWKQPVRSCTVRLFTKWTMPHLRFSDCPRKYASGSQFDSFCTSGVCKCPSWSRAVFASGVDV